ncbi:hypothetical protein BJ122_102224 [Rhodopseudomonas faecalis]|uniref:Uncharacterized protein n=1 Tax=Rhodopseudomonas faecalis TaxID=99655 RepID=A0A318TPR9_9BRAD|nr:hypothetical protein [Rhodopseudomonas faecalis]PYF04998.1 hypothetical protein BJ122_102224 [Rhodopseudomonas faecalis]
MFTTEEEAKRKACPCVERNPLCLGEECMAWRWAEDETEVAFTAIGARPNGDGWEGPTEYRDTNGWVGHTWQRHRVDRVGFCGLIGIAEGQQ